MKEIESKFLEIDEKKIISRLKRLGAKKTFSGIVDASLFDFPDRRIRKRGMLLRLRMVGDLAYLTFKTPISRKKAKIMQEHEVTVSDYGSARKILHAIGVRETERFRKHRTSYALGNTHFEIDKYPQIPAFLEIEAPSTEIICRYAARLGLDPLAAKSWNSSEVFEYYRGMRRIR